MEFIHPMATHGSSFHSHTSTSQREGESVVLFQINQDFINEILSACIDIIFIISLLINVWVVQIQKKQISLFNTYKVKQIKLFGYVKILRVYPVNRKQKCQKVRMRVLVYIFILMPGRRFGFGFGQKSAESLHCASFG